MLVFPGSKYFTTHPEVLIAPRAPIDPELETNYAMRPVRASGFVSPEIASLRLENQQKAAVVVDPLLFHALTFRRASRLL